MDIYEGMGIIIYLPILVMVMFFGLIGWMVIEDMMVTKECNALNGCEVHKCFQDNSVMIFQQTSASLKYQNCLLDIKLKEKLGE